MVLNVHKNQKVGRRFGCVCLCGVGGESIYLSLHCHHQNDSCIKMGSEESHFNVSSIVRDKVTTVSTDHNSAFTVFKIFVFFGSFSLCSSFFWSS